jgi:serine/threonine-protein kinase
MPPERIGRYRLLRVLGTGRIATVYEAHDPVLGREVAIKALHPGLAQDAAMRARFLSEGRLHARIRHPHFVEVYGADEADGLPYLAMEYVPGRSLDEAMADGPLPAAEVIRLVGQVAGALDAIHAADLVHRDVRPASIRLAADGRAVLLDLGIARPAGDADPAATLVLGTPGYLAPEQIDGMVHGGPATDVYQLAATALALLTGRAPNAMNHQPVPDLARLQPPLPAGIAPVLSEALAENPALRPVSAGELAARLARAHLDSIAAAPARHEESGGPSVAPFAAAPPAPRLDQPLVARPGRASARARRRGWRVAAVSAALLLAAAGTAAGLLAGNSTGSIEASPVAVESTPAPDALPMAGNEQRATSNEQRVETTIETDAPPMEATPERAITPRVSASPVPTPASQPTATGKPSVADAGATPQPSASPQPSAAPADYRSPRAEPARDTKPAYRSYQR